MFQIQFLCMHVCQATIQDYKSAGFGILEFFPDFWEKILKNGTVFWAKTQLFVVLPKFDQKNIFQKFKKNLVKKDLNQQKMARDVDFQAPAGREYL
jgi:hypothetical protein